MITKGIIKKGEYFDSVSLMNTAKELGKLKGVADCAVVMGTKENRSILQNSGLLLPEFDKSGDADLLIAVKAQDEAAVSAALEKLNSLLGRKKPAASAGAAPRPRSLDAAVEGLPGANLALISVAGRYAGALAMSALRKGLHVMLFSDNISLEQEIKLKQFGRGNGLLVMGPDCGTAIINGVPLAFANVVKRGTIGMVAAAGTGLQEVTCIVSNEGGGVSQAIGTGGRDIKKDVGGIMFLEGLKALIADKETKTILLVSKPPYPEVMKKISAQAAKTDKPVVAVFLGGDKAVAQKAGLAAASDLKEAALLALHADAYAGKKSAKAVLSTAAKTVQARLLSDQKKLKSEAKKLSAKVGRGRKYVRGLFSGGTFCTETQLIMKDLLGEVYSNVPLSAELKLADSLKSVKNTVIDLGEDEFTVGRPHPMIDYALRCKRIIAEAQNKDVAVIALDVVLGYGSHGDPLSELLPAIEKARKGAGKGIVFVASVTGTDADPQSRGRVLEGLRAAGVAAYGFNADAAVVAGHIIRFLGGAK
ncbi:MAG: acyl-CoA synthetase FdrA [Elusimicrobia bacterium]|nr:acyl-CoA synthetase FdrA [Elusimicrobiota bacterium]